jgi:hypothetical protein
MIFVTCIEKMQLAESSVRDIPRQLPIRPVTRGSALGFPGHMKQAHLLFIIEKVINEPAKLSVRKTDRIVVAICS